MTPLERYEARKIKFNIEQAKRKAWFQQREPLDRVTGWLMAFTALLFVATILNAVILWVTDHTLKLTLEANSRAWIAPGPESIDPPEVGQPVLAQLNFRNSGRSPALKVNYIMKVTGVDMDSDYESLVHPTDDLCAQLGLGSRTIFPTAENDNRVTFPNAEATMFTEEMEQRKKTMWWRGCFVYETHHKVRKTAFCYWLRNSDSFGWYWQDCGIEAD